MSERPVIAVVLDRGSASLLDIVDGLSPLGEPLLALWPGDHTDELAPLAEELTTVVRLDATDHDESARRLAAHSPDAIVTFSESRLSVTAEIAERLGLPYHSPATVELLRDKYAQRRRLRERGADSVRSVAVRRPEDWAGALAAVGLPAVLKPLCGEGSRSTHLIEDAERGAALVEQLLSGPGGENSLVLEEYLRGRDCGPYGDHISVESAVTDGRVSHWAVTGKFPLEPPFREVGHLRPAPLAEAERAAALEVVTAALHALDITTGITHTELKLTADGPRIIEVNGRLGGFQPQLARLSGDFDAITLAGRVALGEDVSDVRAGDHRVVFARAVPAPPGGGTYVGVRGLREALAVEGVENVVIPHSPGSRLASGVQTGELAWVEGSVADHETMRRVIERVLSVLSFTVADPDGTHRVVTGSAGAATAAPVAAVVPAGRRTGAPARPAPVW
ncbi:MULTISPECIES: ATP-grasp domain-containing protein [unclassified Streptomyces]|uniref:ATP-grasp domain-containing protein n=1 Tax=unclassified Streptomyces TaxID=2593676 RepID=UPI0011E7F3F0|nr:ATP-grasp domain-containing protein [Streptomyces sp. sk2.1]TXS68608.1 ATP-grasp domain-containing protein [Streptomyces sp. sk2.1]